MTTDPLDVRRSGLVDQADEVVVQLGDRRAWPWLQSAGEDPADLLARLTTAARAARAAMVVADDRDKELGARRLAVQPALAEVRAWQVELRARLRRAPPDEVARRAVAELRGLVVHGGNRLIGALAMLNTTAERLRDHREALTVEVDVEALAARADVLRERLVMLQHRVDEATADQIRAGEQARSDVEHLRGLLREVRSVWRLAASLSGGTLPPLHLAMAKSGVSSRPGVREAARGGAGPG